MMELAGVLAAALLLVTLVTLEVRRPAPGTGPSTAPGPGKPAGAKLQSPAKSTRIIVGVLWAASLLLLLPRVVGLLT